MLLKIVNCKRFILGTVALAFMLLFLLLYVPTKELLLPHNLELSVEPTLPNSEDLQKQIPRLFHQSSFMLWYFSYFTDGTLCKIAMRMSRLHEIVTEALASSWTPEEASIISQTSGAETVQEAVVRVENGILTPRTEEAGPQTPVKTSSVAAKGTDSVYICTEA